MYLMLYGVCMISAEKYLIFREYDDYARLFEIDFPSYNLIILDPKYLVIIIIKYIILL